VSVTRPRTADIYIDGVPPRLSELSYLIPEGMAVAVGDAVRCPFGKTERFGVVLRLGTNPAATRQILEVYGRRAESADVEACAELARRHLVGVGEIAARLSPRQHKGADPVDAGPVVVADMVSDPPLSGRATRRKFIVPAPAVNMVHVAAREAARLAESGQVLVLCPTVASVNQVLACFTSGAARLDAAAARGAWRGFVEGTVTVGVATRAGALYSPANLSGIVVVDEAHPGHVESALPHTHARDVAGLRASFRDCELVLVGSHPTAAGLGVARCLWSAGGSSEWPTVQIADRSAAPSNAKAFPTSARVAVAAALRSGREVLVVASSKQAKRRCARCSTPAPCQVCDAPACVEHEPLPCVRCSATQMRVVGWDPQRVVTFFGGKVSAVASDGLMKTSPPAQGKGRLVVVMDADAPTRLSIPEPESAVARLMVSACRAAGADGSVVAVSDVPDSPVLAGFVAADARAVARPVWDRAKADRLPPFGRLVTVSVKRTSRPSFAGWPGTVHGPREMASGEWEALICCDDRDLPVVGRRLDALRAVSKVRFSVS
jgi:primosomal protein N'